MQEASRRAGKNGLTSGGSRPVAFKTSEAGASDEEVYIIVLATGAIEWVTECPLPLWDDSEGVTHYLRGVFVRDDSGRSRMCFFEKPMRDYEALAKSSRSPEGR